MKKLFTLAAAVLASFSLWAVEPNFESYDWQSQEAAEAVAGNHDGIVISYAGLGNPGNVSGHWYIPNNQNLKNSDNPWKYFGIAANAQIDSIAILYCPNDDKKTDIAWVAWGKDVTPNQYVLGHGLTAGTTGSKAWDKAVWETIDLSEIEAYTVYVSRSIREFREIGASSNLANFGAGKTFNILGVRVWLHETKTIVSTVESLTAVTINDYPLAAADFTKLLSAHTLILEDSAYVTAPVVKFTKHTVITYDDESTKEKDEVIEKTSQQAQASMWGATVDIAGVAYTVYTIKPLSYTVTYKLADETVLGTEVVAAGGHPAEYAQYEVMPLSTFNGWYDEGYLEEVDLAEVVVNSDMSFYADFDKAYATSVNIEQWILDNGKDNAAFKTVLENAHFYYENINDLDSLNDLEKKDRNEPYLGLKIKKNGGYIACNVLPGTVIRIKFGYVAETVLAIAGNDTMLLTPTNNKIDELEFPIMVEKLVKLQTTSDKTVVIKQIMINDTIKDVELPEQTVFPINITAENGKVTTAWEGKGEKHISAPAGVTVTLTFTPDKGYEFDGVTLDGEELTDVGGVYSFTMPAKAVAVVATFKQSATAIDNADAAAKAVKVLREGVLFIEKNGVRYNAQGAVVR